MRSRFAAALLLLTLPIAAEQWQLALPGYHYEFPRDHFSHPDYATEWWYYTGNLRAADGHRYGFELTFFRQGIDLESHGMVAQTAEASASDPWTPKQVYLAHLALSDIDGGEFYHTERLNRAGPGLAGVDEAQGLYWNGNWQVHWTSLTSGEQELQAVCDRFTLHLNLDPEKPFVIHGKDGISQKAAERGKASHYISFTRLGAHGQLQWKGSTFELEGTAWMDHEFFTDQLDSTQAGWDWFAIQLDNREELMLYRLRKKSGGGDPYSSGTFVDAQGKAHFLSGSDFSLTAADPWKSPLSGTAYPLAWQIRVPPLDLELSASTQLKNQELFSRSSISPSYWEGAVSYEGTMGGSVAHGVGYLEMTGYDKALTLGQR